MKKKRVAVGKRNRNYGWAWLVLLGLYLMYIATQVFVFRLHSEVQAVSRCDSLCRRAYSVGTWQTVDNSEACKGSVYFCECSPDFRDVPTEKNFKIDVATGRVLPTDVAYEILNAREEKSCW